MGVFTQIDERELEGLLGEYGIGELRGWKGIPAGSVNSNFAIDVTGGRYFLRVYEEQDDDGARVEASLLTYLAERGVPAAAPASRTDGALVSTLAGKPAAIFPWRDGEMVCQGGVTRAHAFKVGEALARVHRAGEGAVVGAGRFRAEDLQLRLDAIARADDPVLAAQAAPLRAKLATWLAARDGELPRGVVHGDLFRDNVLWSGNGEISALLDFESASSGVMAFDVMVTVLSWCFGEGLDLSLARSMVDGYRSVRELTEAERDGLLAEGCFAALRFEITRITDYAMRASVGPRVMKDWRRFAQRLAALEALGTPGLRAALGL